MANTQRNDVWSFKAVTMWEICLVMVKALATINAARVISIFRAKLFQAPKIFGISAPNSVNNMPKMVDLNTRLCHAPKYLKNIWISRNYFPLKVPLVA